MNNQNLLEIIARQSVEIEQLKTALVERDRIIAEYVIRERSDVVKNNPPETLPHPFQFIGYGGPGAKLNKKQAYVKYCRLYNIPANSQYDLAVFSADLSRAIVGYIGIRNNRQSVSGLKLI